MHRPLCLYIHAYAQGQNRWLDHLGLHGQLIVVGTVKQIRKVEELLDLALKDLIFDDEFIAALDEKESVTIQLIPNQIG